MELEIYEAFEAIQVFPYFQSENSSYSIDDMTKEIEIEKTSVRLELTPGITITLKSQL